MLPDFQSDISGLLMADDDHLEEIILSESHPKIICASFYEKFERALELGLTELYEDQLILVADGERKYFVRGDIEAKNPEGLHASDWNNEFGLKAGMIEQPYGLQEQVAIYSFDDDYWILARVVDMSEDYY
ncbi:hypothetical protein JW968_02945 [Candidatus Woesearchaeota archaeon]|nr:hypothetical protein [Candidatus Woesearchaeota archaeon]